MNQSKKKRQQTQAKSLSQGSDSSQTNIHASEPARVEKTLRPATKRPGLLKLIGVALVIWIGILCYLAYRVAF